MKRFGNLVLWSAAGAFLSFGAAACEKKDEKAEPAETEAKGEEPKAEEPKAEEPKAEGEAEATPTAGAAMAAPADGEKAAADGEKAPADGEKAPAGDHPAGDHPKGDHPAGEHPK